VQGTNSLDGFNTHAPVRTLRFEVEVDSWQGLIQKIWLVPLP
jgi:hypothetical protein